MRPYIKLSVFTCFLCLHSAWIVAQESAAKSYRQPIQDVFQTELVYPQEEGEVQITFSPEFRRGSGANHLALPFLAEYGLTDSWQVELRWNAFQGRFPKTGTNTLGTGNLEAGTQYSFMNIGNTGFHTALGFEIDIPLGNENEETDGSQWEYAPYASIALDLPALNNTQLFMQAGICFTGDEGWAGKELNVSGGLFVPFNKLVFTSELSWRNSKLYSGDENQLYLTPGIIINLPSSWEAGLGIPVGLNKNSDKFTILALLTYEFSLNRKNR
jgi:hypothetical protein